ncbi:MULTISPECIES: lipid asymmetry maintenance protein MlaB [Pseudomonas]|uniref:STAS domain-containing protein n=1 Tax=Pseudomonas TaxID=286 RepID=UPI000876A5C6|nr:MULTISPECIES: STAS domain-containing protein [Pseudomonas]MDB6444861.1 STAS domain-containing protein [Pseudomonas sp. 21TX0197]MDT8905974.1 STAS domain-containing protein [Pseudomonas prosekii]NHN67700.1 STAS domain-containing protein [Pseudomonas fluorescens]ROO33234.1 sulfate transporter [Pseudomonas sp. 7SR1]ROO36666.1 sulfate transporter [Pseudomonas sp. AF76]
MPLLFETEDDTTQVRIDGELTIYTAAELAAQLLPSLGNTPRMALDLSQITEMDGAGLQLLLMALREAPKAGTELTLTGRSKAVTETLELCNLQA